MTHGIHVEVSAGELIDKLTILEIRLSHIDDPVRRDNVVAEHQVVASAYATIARSSAVGVLKDKLRHINETLWNTEDAIRDCERRGDFGPDFIRLARSVYKTNDQRSRVKSEINALLRSRLVEEKSYRSY